MRVIGDGWTREAEWADDTTIDEVTAYNQSVGVARVFLCAHAGKEFDDCPDVIRIKHKGRIVWEFDFRVERFTYCDIPHIAKRDGAVPTTVVEVGV